MNFTSIWNVSSDYYNLTDAKAGTPIRASCVEIPQEMVTPSGSLQQGQYVSGEYALCNFLRG